MQVSIIIVNYNTKKITNNCIDSIITQTKDIEYEIILVDNASTDGSKEYFEKRNDIKYIYSNENLGFGRANNLGAKQAKGEFLLLLNSDTLLVNNSIYEFLIFFQSNENLEIGALGTMLLNQDFTYGSSYGDFVNPFQDIVYEIIPPNKKEFFFEQNELDYFKVDWISGACIFIKRNLFSSLDGFNENFFMYCEEVDLQKRITKKELNNFIIKNPKIIHFGEMSSQSKTNKIPNILKYIWTSESKIFYVKNNYNKLIYISFKLLYILIVGLKMLFNNKFNMQSKLTFFKKVFY